MCGIPCANSNKNELLVTTTNNLNMPPSVTLGSEPPKITNVAERTYTRDSQQSCVPLNREISDVDESAAMQKAIAASLQEQLPPSSYYSEDRDPSELSPYDIKRRHGTYVGLKNIGNSCWFNVVIQPLFHIPAFREIIFNYSTDVNFETCSKSKPSGLLQIFRLLCANLLASERKFVDPTECVTLFQNEEMMKNTQQDVCEFIHKLLQKLEEEYKVLNKHKGVEKENAECKIPNEADFLNPILNLFYGESKKEDYNGPKKEPFGQYPLSVQNYSNIHESILASMTGVSMQEIEIIEPVLQENWFKRLPPVLIFALSRYEFSKEKQRAEKVHNKFDFSDCLYLDRYMETNKDIIKEKHKKVAEIKNELTSLYKTLDQYQKFGSEAGKYPIVDILKCTLEFAERKYDAHTEYMDVDSATVSDFEMLNTHDKCQSMEVETKLRECEEASKASSQFPESSSFKFIGYPAPETILDEELDILKTCIPRWQAEMEQKVFLLNKAINDLEQQLNEIYDEPSLQCIPYKLHAVIVHEGQASGGHYWVYIYDNNKNVWLKFNDIQVTESCWTEVLQDSVGGQNNASAYCLMYIDKTRYDEIFLSEKQECDSSMENLPIDLQEYVKAETINFFKELRDYELKRTIEAARERENKLVPATAPNSPEACLLDEDEAKFYLYIKTMMSELLENCLKKLDEAEINNISEWIQASIQNSRVRIKELANIKRGSDQSVEYQCGEPSILDFSIYLYQNNQKETFVFLYGQEILWQLVQVSEGPSKNALEHQIKTCLKKLMAMNVGGIGPVYNGWKKHYHMYIKCAWYFNCGYKQYLAKHLEAALSYSLHCLNLHKQLENESPDGPHKTLDRKLLFRFHRVCFKQVNDNLIESFLKAANEAEVLEVDHGISKFILPALFFSINSKFEDDVKVADFTRSRWIEVFDKVNHIPIKSRMFQPIITKLFSNGEDESNQGSVASLPLLKFPPYPAVLSIYEEYKKIAKSVISSFEKFDFQTSDL